MRSLRLGSFRHFRPRHRRIDLGAETDFLECFSDVYDPGGVRKGSLDLLVAVAGPVRKTDVITAFHVLPLLLFDALIIVDRVDMRSKDFAYYAWRRHLGSRDGLPIPQPIYATERNQG